MEVITAKTAGFCFGVERAVKTVYEELDKGKKVYTFGPIVHNQNVIDDLSARGVSVIDADTFAKAIDETIVIRAHGVSEKIVQSLENKGLNIVDATCPFVKRIHKLAREASEEGRTLVVIGDPDHPEVKGILGWAGDDAKVVKNIEDVHGLGLKFDTKLTVVSQTTFNAGKFKEIIAQITKLYYDVTWFNTVCNATKERQEEAMKIASVVDVMIVIGDEVSSNTRKLVEICNERCNRTIFIRTVKDLERHNLHGAQIVGITAGASTPNYIIEEVQNHVRTEF